MAHQETKMNVSDSRRLAAAGAVSKREVTSPPHSGLDEPRLEDEIDIGYYARFLVWYWKLLVVCAALGSIIGYVVAFKKPTLYEAATTVLASQASSQVNISTTLALMENNSLADDTIRETGLDKSPFNLSPQDFVRGALRIDAVPGTNLVKVKVTVPNPHKAAEASTIFARKAVKLNQVIADAESLAVRGQLEAHVAAAAGRLRDAEQQLLAYQNEAHVEVLRKDTFAMLDGREHLLKLLIDIEAEKGRLTAAEQEIQKLEPVLSVKRSVRSEEALRRAAQSQAAIRPQPSVPSMADPDALDLSDPFVNPVYQTLAFQIAMSRTRLAGLERERRETVSAHKLVGDRFTKLSELHRRELHLASLQGNYDLAKRVHADLALRYEQSRTEPVNRMVQLQIIDEAVPADRPLSKKLIESTALGLAAGLILAVFAALAWNAGMRSSRVTHRT